MAFNNQYAQFSLADDYMTDISIQYQHSASINIYYRVHQLEPAKYFSGLQQIVIFDYINQQSTSVEYCKKYCRSFLNMNN